MCYSSQIAAAYQQYLKLTGATIDLDQFREVYGFRHLDSSIRIARAVDRWFDEPTNADERAIKELIDRHRAEAIARLEGEVFERAASAVQTVISQIGNTPRVPPRARCAHAAIPGVSKSVG